MMLTMPETGNRRPYIYARQSTLSLSIINIGQRTTDNGHSHRAVADTQPIDSSIQLAVP